MALSLSTINLSFLGVALLVVLARPLIKKAEGFDGTTATAATPASNMTALQNISNFLNKCITATNANGTTLLQIQGSTLNTLIVNALKSVSTQLQNCTATSCSPSLLTDPNFQITLNVINIKGKLGLSNSDITISKFYSGVPQIPPATTTAATTAAAPATQLPLVNVPLSTIKVPNNATIYIGRNNPFISKLNIPNTVSGVFIPASSPLFTNSAPSS